MLSERTTLKILKLLQNASSLFGDSTLTAERLATLFRGASATETEDVEDKLWHAIKLATTIQTERRVPKNDPSFADPLLIAEALTDYGADLPTILAAIIYPSMRPVKGPDTKREVKFDQAYIDLISADPYLGADVAKIARNALEISEINLLAPPAIKEVTSREGT